MQLTTTQSLNPKSGVIDIPADFFYYSKMYHNQKIPDIFRELETGGNGLDEREAEKRLAESGPNEIREKKKKSALIILLSQFNNFLIYILIFAAAVSLMIGEVADSVVIMVILVLIGIIGFIQEYRAEKALDALKRMASLKSRVIRGGRERQIDATRVVPGDIVVLETGDKVPADARIFELHNTHTQESLLTGESSPVRKETGIVRENTPVADQKNMLFSGTVLTAGRCKAVVVRTGMQTEVGKIARMIQEVEKEPTPLQKRLAALGRTLGIATIGICMIIFLAGLLTGKPWLEMFQVAVSLAVAAVPEGLPAVVVVGLALGARKMVNRNVLIRKLPSVETLGSTTVICSDKTGTLTRNEMTVTKLYIPDKTIDVTGSGYQTRGDFLFQGQKVKKEEISLLLKIGALNNNASLRGGMISGDPTEGALIVAAEKAGFSREKLKGDHPWIDELEFTSERKIMTTVHRVGKEKIAYVKGAPEILLKQCSFLYRDGKIRELSGDGKKKILEINRKFASQALRVLAFAYRKVTRKPEEKDLIFVGLQAMMDPPRDGVRESIATCKKAGIKVVMITGDQENTARAIARELGIQGKSITGAQLEKQSDLESRVEEIAIYARVNPAHKLKIVEALKKKGHIVAMTGDGVNDAPALKKADIGAAMGIAGTDVAKEASEMVLTDDNFASIVHAVEQGRTIFDNIKKFLALLLSGNIGELLIIFLAILMGFRDPVSGEAVIPLLAIQILWINLITDGLPALALSVDPPEPGIMERPPRQPRETIFQGLAGYIFVYPFIMLTGITLIFARTLSSGGGNKARTMAFTAVILYELFQVFSCRSLTEPSFKAGIFKNKILVAAVGLSLLLHLMLLYIPFFQSLFKVTPLSLEDWAVIVLAASTGFAYLEIHKYLGMKKRLRTR